jgi:uncharacterized protein (TIGR03545 family)
MSTDTTAAKPVKQKGPIRWEAIIPVLIISVGAYAYFTWYFDNHLKKLFEYVGTQANGAEVNVAGVRTSFLRGSFDLDGLEVTDKEQPKRNLISIENVHFQYLWDALLRMKFVVNDASINQIRAFSPRKSPGRVLPPAPATPSKMEALEKEVIGQFKARYSDNMLGDLIALLEGADPKDQLQQIREELKTEKRLKEMVADVNAKQAHWKGEVERLSDTKKLKAVEVEVQKIKDEKNLLKQAEGVARLNGLLKEVQRQAKDVQDSGKKLEGELKAVAAYPKEAQALVNEDIASLKSRFKVPELDVKDMAMALFHKEFGSYLVKARKYQALAQQYLPEKKEREEIVPPPRELGKSYEFPITTSYPLFWLKRAAISSRGTVESYTGNVSGELLDVTTSPRWVRKPTVLDLRGDFPASQLFGVQARVAADFSGAVAEQRLDLKVGRFAVAERMFAQSDKLTFGIKEAQGSSTLSAKMREGTVNMQWNAAISQTQWVVESRTKLAQEILQGVVAGIPTVTIEGSAVGPWKSLDLRIASNLGDELGKGLKAQVGLKVAEAEAKIRALVDEKIKAPQAQLMAQLGANGDLLSKTQNLGGLYKQHEDRIKAEIEKLKSGGSNSLKDQGKKLLKGFKL